MSRLSDVGRKFALALGFPVFIIVGGYLAMLPGNLIDAWFDDTVEVSPALVAEFNTPEMQERAEWLYHADDRLGLLMASMEGMEWDRELLAEDNDGAPVSEWSLAEKQKMMQWQKIMANTHAEYNALAKQYNTQMKALRGRVTDGTRLGDLDALLIGLPTHYDVRGEK